MVERKGFVAVHRLPHDPVDHGAVVRMDVRQERVVADERAVFDAVDAIQLVRPPDAIAADVPLPAAEARHFLRLPETLVHAHEFVRAQRHFAFQSVVERPQLALDGPPAGDLCGHRQHHGHRNADEALEQEQRIVRRLTAERAEAAERSVDGNRDEHRRSERRHPRAEPERRPEQHRDNQERVVRAPGRPGAEHRKGDEAEGDEHRGQLADVAVQFPERRPAIPQQDEGRHDDRADGVAQPPRQPDRSGGELRSRVGHDDGGRPDRGRDR